MKNLKGLLEQYLKNVNSKENQGNKKYWENANEPYLVERWRGRSARRENTPFTIAMDISGYARVLGINCVDYYNHAEDQLYEQLRYAIWEFENLKCNRYFENTVFISFGSIFEATMFGTNIHYLPGQAPWIDEKNPIFKEKENILMVKPFNFFSTGLCGKANEFYDTMKKLTEGYDVKVMYPITLRSPFSVAIMVRGFTELLTDIYNDQEFFKDLMRLITDFLKGYAKARAEFLGEPIAKCMLFNDEISASMLSNEIYESLILPYEIELSEFCNGVSYWHSCGVTDPFYNSICTIPGLKMMHLGPWSDIQKAVEVFSQKDIVIEICLSSTADVYDASEEQIRQKLEHIKIICDGKIKYSVRADGLAILNSIEEDLAKINLWSKVAKEIFPGY
jgi:uroporphyrinogen-III decarboxylase